MRGNLADIDALLRRWPADDADFEKSLRRRAAAFGDDCGCAVGGTFAVASLLGWVAHVVLTGDVTIGRLLAGVGIALLAAIVGKGVGLGVARVRLRLLWREASRRAGAGVGHVDVH